MAQQLRQPVLRFAQRLDDRCVLHADAQRQRVDEQPQGAVGADAAWMRPNSTVPNTTSSRPLSRARTSAQARWNRLAA